MCKCVSSIMCPLHLIVWYILSSLQHDIVDINDIFRDLGTMVHDQGEVIGNEKSSNYICMNLNVFLMI